MDSNAIRRLALPEREAAALQAWTVARDGKSLFAALPAGSITRVVDIPMGDPAAARTLFTVTSPVWYIEAGADRRLFVNLVDRPQELVRLSPDGVGTPERIGAFPLSSSPDQVLLLPDGRAVTPASAFGRTRLMSAEKGKDPLPLVNTQEETAAPMTMAGPREIAFVIGPAPHSVIALADTSSGRVTARIAPAKGVITALTASPDGATLYFCAGGFVWNIPSSGGEARAVSSGEYAIMDRSGRGLIVVRGERSHTRLFQVPLDGAPEREIPVENSPPLYAVHAGYLSSGSMDAAGRLIVALSPVDSWFNPLGILDTNTGRITRLAADSLSDRHSGVWTPDGRILAGQVVMRAAIWAFQPLAR